MEAAEFCHECSLQHTVPQDRGLLSLDRSAPRGAGAIGVLQNSGTYRGDLVKEVFPLPFGQGDNLVSFDTFAKAKKLPLPAPPTHDLTLTTAAILPGNPSSHASKLDGSHDPFVDDLAAAVVGGACLLLGRHDAVAECRRGGDGGRGGGDRGKDHAHAAPPPTLASMARLEGHAEARGGWDGGRGEGGGGDS